MCEFALSFKVQADITALHPKCWLLLKVVSWVAVLFHMRIRLIIQQMCSFVVCNQSVSQCVILVLNVLYNVNLFSNGVSLVLSVL